MYTYEYSNQNQTAHKWGSLMLTPTRAQMMANKKLGVSVNEFPRASSSVIMQHP